MITGIGTDMIEIERVIRACDRKAFLERVFTRKERELIEGDAKKSASNFAVKEAVVKAFGVGFGKVKPNEVEVLRDEKGKPFVVLYGEAKQLVSGEREVVIHVSLTNTKKYALAFVVVEMGGWT